MLHNSNSQFVIKDYWKKVIFDGMFVLSIFFYAYSMSSYFNFSDQYFLWAKDYENSLDIDELPIALLASLGALLWFSHRRIRESSNLISQNHALLKRVLEVQEDERKRIAQDLHDELGQYLIAVKVQATSLLEDKASLPDTLATAQRIVNSADHAYHATRHMMHSLRPVALDALGLSAALEHLVETWKDTQKLGEPSFSNTNYSILIDDNIDGLSEQMNIAIFRIVQEALTNIAKHAKASQATIHIQCESDMLILTIRDDGIGFDIHQKNKGYGLLGILERTDALGGSLSIKSNSGNGTQITVTIKKK
ncbi:MAG: sensor histidine kinase [Oscillospiraceae bacterium]